MEILEAYDLTGSFRAAAKLAGWDHHTVARHVALRDEGRPVEGMRAERLADPFLVKIEEWVKRSQGQIGGDVAHGKLVAMGYQGSERTTRRAIAAAKRAWRAGNRRVYRPWIPEPGLWLQWDWGQGPRVAGRLTELWCAWLAWSRFRVVLPTTDRTLPTVLACLDATFRRLGGVPADPESKGGAEATVRLRKQPAAAVHPNRVVAHWSASSSPWVRAAPPPARIDPASNRVVHTLPGIGSAQLGAEYGRLAVGAGAVWLSDAEDHTLLRIDPNG